MTGRPVVSSEQMRALDRCAIEEFGIPGLILMENAGRSVFEVAAELLEEGVKANRVAVVCGQGNNGGDGFVVARHLHNAGAQVRIFYFGDRERAKGDALTNLLIAEKMGLDIDYSRDVSSLRSAVKESDLVIDALLGTGTKGELKGEAAEVVGAMNLGRSGLLIAVDIPSGMDADTGALLGPTEGLAQSAVIADTTVTFGFCKIGLVTQPGADFAGDVIVADIGIPRKVDAEKIGTRTFLLDSETVSPWPSPWRPTDANKGDFGHVAIVAGSVGMTGAATLAAEGALRIGTGLVTLAVPESLNDIMEVKVTEGMTIPVPQGRARAFGMASLEGVLEMIEKRDAVVIGPGFGRDQDTIAFTLELIKRIE